VRLKASSAPRRPSCSRPSSSADHGAHRRAPVQCTPPQGPDREEVRLPFRPARGADRPGAAAGALCQPAAGSAAGRCAVRRSPCARPAGMAAAGRPAGVQRHPRDPGAVVRAEGKRWPGGDPDRAPAA